MIEKTNAVGFLGLDDASREQQLLGLRPTNLAAERPGGIDPAVGGSEETEPRVLAPDPHVERGCEHGCTTVSKTVHHADYGLGTGRDFQSSSRIAHLVLLFTGVALVIFHLLLDIAAG